MFKMESNPKKRIIELGKEKENLLLKFIFLLKNLFIGLN